MLKRFKQAYVKALNDGVDQFEFEGNTFLVSYARYLIEYLEDKLQ